MKITAAERRAHNATLADWPASKAYYVGIHRYLFQAGVPAEILGVKMVRTVDGLELRPSFHVRFPDGRETYAVIADKDFCGLDDPDTFYEIISEEQVKAGKIPPVRR